MSMRSYIFALIAVFCFLPSAVRGEGDWVFKDIDDAGTPISDSFNGYIENWSYSISGSNGSYSGSANAFNEWNIILLGSSTTGTQTVSGSQMEKCTEWRPAGECGCNHGAPDNATASWNFDADADGNANGDANNGDGLSSGSVACLAYAKVTISGVKANSLTVNLNPSYSEGATTVSGTLSVSKDGPAGSVTITTTLGGDVFATNPAADSISDSGIWGPGSLVGQHLKAHGIVKVLATANNGASRARAEANTNITTCSFTLNDGGTHANCCNGTKPHGGHGEIRE